ncbi:GbsR/MarR family transcriptional regulator [Bacillus kwashiorkori]|uniref:GbsR/MarR family transcriptional regulator n=1 Tax=Bacillus kwashiorkori TaxID=1522318 RepID=UPI000784DC51|nr:GbsR/MarR family transcriptional regulator [Bacillus kwashiorkori]
MVNRLNEEVQQKLIKIEERFIDNIAENMRPLGIPTTVGRVLGIIQMNRAPMTLNELSEATGMSKTRMSQVVREMVEHNIAYKVYEKGVRKDIYDVEQDYYETFISILTTNWENIIKKNRRSGKLFQEELYLILGQEDLDESLKEKAKVLLAEIEKWLNYYDWLDRFVNFLDSDEIFKYVPR